MPKRRRYGTNEQHHFLSGSYIALGAFFVLWQVFSSIYTMPIFVGLFFCYIYNLIREHESTLYDLDFRFYFSLAYLVFIEITHDFYLFSSWFAFFVFYYFCAEWIKTNFKFGKFMPVFFCICAYLLLFMFNAILSYLDSAKFALLGLEYYIDMLIEAALCYLIFKDRLK